MLRYQTICWFIYIIYSAAFSSRVSHVLKTFDWVVEACFLIDIISSNLKRMLILL